MTATAHVQPGNAALRVRLPEQSWFVEITRLDGEGEPGFAGLHEQVVGPAQVRTFLPGVETLRWAPSRTLPGLPEGCHAVAGPFRVDVSVPPGAETTWERALAEFQAWLRPRGKRLA